MWNAFEPSKSSIGSTGGSAVATALSLASFAMGSQTGDSLWGPSSGASLYSLRGTDGMQSLTGAMPLTWLQDYAGAITRSITDLADVLNVVTGTDPEDFLTAEADARRPADWRTALDPNALQGKRIGYYPPTFVDPFGTTGTSTAMLKALKDTVTAAGGTVVEIGAPPSSPPGAGGDRGYEGWARWIEAHPESPYKEAAEIITSQKRLPVQPPRPVHRHRPHDPDARSTARWRSAPSTSAGWRRGWTPTASTRWPTPACCPTSRSTTARRRASGASTRSPRPRACRR